MDNDKTPIMGSVKLHCVEVPCVEVYCAEVEVLLDSYLDGEIESRCKKSFERHLAKCESCRSLVSDCQQILIVAQDLAQRQIPSEVSSRLHQRLAEEIRKSGDTRPKLQLVESKAK